LEEKAKQVFIQKDYDALLVEINHFPPQLAEDKKKKQVPSGDFII